MNRFYFAAGILSIAAGIILMITTFLPPYELIYSARMFNFVWGFLGIMAGIVLLARAYDEDQPKEYGMI